MHNRERTFVQESGNRAPAAAAEAMVTVARMYYERGLKQERVAQALGISRSQVSRYLTSAHKNGIVEVRVIAPDDRDIELQTALEQAFPRLSHAHVVPSIFSDGPIVMSRVAAAGADVLAGLVSSGDTVCVGAGRTLARLVSALPTGRHDNVVVVQALGNAGHEGHDIDYNAIAAATATAFGGRAYHVNAPAILGVGFDAKRLEESSPPIAEALSVARSADVFVVSVGLLATDALFVTTGLLSQDDIASVARLDPAGDICGHFYDLDGQPVSTSFESRIVGIDLVDLARSERVLAVAAGIGKANAVRGALAGGYITNLVVDESLARAVLSR